MPTLLKSVAPLRHKNYRLLFIAYTISMLGDGLWLVAVPWLALGLGGSSSDLGLVVGAESAGLLSCVLVGGGLADRFSRRLVIGWSFLASLASLSSLLVAAAATGHLRIGQLVGVAFVLGAAAAISGPTSDAFTPDLVPEADLHAANAMESTLRSLAVRMAGPAIGGLLVSAVSPLTIIAINAASFVSAAVCVWLINTKQAPPTGTSTVASAPPQPPSEPVSYCHAWRYLVGERWLWVLILWSGVVLLLQSGPRQVLLPLIIHYDLGGSARDYGLLVAVTGISAVVASIAVGSRTPPSDYPRCMLLSWTVGAAPLALMFNIPSFWMLLPLGAISGCFSTIGNIYWSTLIQTVVPSTVLGRVISIDWLGSLALVPLSAVLAGASTAAHISHWLFILGGALPILFTVATLRWVRLPATRSAARSEAEPCAPSAAA